MNPEAIQKHLNRILPSIRQPGRYTGGELNQIEKDWAEISVKSALFFPEVYDLGMSNLGIMILYDLINKRSNFLAERVYLPWVDMQSALRENNIPLYSLESKHALRDFDLIGVSLPYESLYTNFLTGLDLAGINLRQKDRSSDDPLIVAGGHGVFNPEPVAPFLDAVVIGEGEEVFLEILTALESKLSSGANRTSRLKAISEIPGVYIPSFYKVEYFPTGKLSHFTQKHPSAPDKITKRIVPELPPAPTNFIVPYIDVVHNRAPIEIMRGCTRGCRFCHAGMINRPVRERTVDEILEAMKKIIPATGYSEIGLLSLSSSDYTNIIQLVQKLNQHFQESGLSISLPSLRIESVSVDLMDALSDQRRSGFTLAPEAATPKMRRIINKPISDDQLLNTAQEIYQRGWHTIKLYFMIGLPGENLDDVVAIADLSKKVLKIGEASIGNRAQVHVSVSTFVPKPFTPFQWVKTASIPEIDEKLKLLRSEIRGRGLKFNWNNPENTIFESWLSRGDRRLADVIQTAWENGARFDAWREHFDFQVWLNAFETCKLDPDFYAHRLREEKELLPWDHIESGVKKSILWEDYLWSLEGKLRPDCRDGCYGCGILPIFSDLRKANPGSQWLCPEINIQ
jgi:radical SAM family uncharacterized protein